MANTTRGGLEPAVIVNKDTNEKVHCMFNPNEYTLAKSNQWTQEKEKGVAAAVGKRKRGTRGVHVNSFTIFNNFLS